MQIGGFTAHSMMPQLHHQAFDKHETGSSKGPNLEEFTALRAKIAERTGGTLATQEIEETFNGNDEDGHGERTTAKQRSHRWGAPQDRPSGFMGLKMGFHNRALHKYDADGSKGLNLEEYTALRTDIAERTGGPLDTQAIKETFNGIDKDSDGELTFAELRSHRWQAMQDQPSDFMGAKMEFGMMNSLLRMQEHECALHAPATEDESVPAVDESAPEGETVAAGDEPAPEDESVPAVDESAPESETVAVVDVEAELIDELLEATTEA